MAKETNITEETKKDVDDLEVTTQAYSIENKLLLVKVGSPAEPAGEPDITNVRKSLAKILKDVNCLVYVTHHNVNIEVI